MSAANPSSFATRVVEELGGIFQRDYWGSPIDI